jgi:hypothetical protein
MLCAILALALTAQFSQEPLVGDTVAITGGHRLLVSCRRHGGRLVPTESL